MFPLVFSLSYPELLIMGVFIKPSQIIKDICTGTRKFVLNSFEYNLDRC